MRFLTMQRDRQMHSRISPTPGEHLGVEPPLAIQGIPTGEQIRPAV